ncbi:MAG: hypothetical protein AAFY36_09580 [Bacteroidota bacterium]
MILLPLIGTLVVALIYLISKEYWRQRQLCWPQVRAVFTDKQMKLGYVIYKLGKRIKVYTNYLQEPYYYMAKGQRYKNGHIEPKRRRFGKVGARAYMSYVCKRMNGNVRFNPYNPKESYMLIEGPHFSWWQLGVFVLAMFVMLISVAGL